MSELAAGSDAPVVQQQQRGDEDEREDAEMLRLLQEIAVGTELFLDMLEVRLAAPAGKAHVDDWSWVMTSAASRGREQLLAALLKQRSPPAKTTKGSSSSTSTSKRGRSGSSTRAAVNLQSLIKDLSHACLAAAEQGQAQCLRLLLEACTSSAAAAAVTELLQARNDRGGTALLLAAGQGHVDCLRLLLEHSPEVQVAASDEDGRTALMMAARSGDASCLQLLLDQSPKAQVAASDEHGQNALMLAAWCGHFDCIQLLLDHSPEVQVAAVDQSGRNALMHAAAWGDAAHVELLLAHSPGVQVAAEGAEGDCALALAAGYACVDCVKLLLAQPHSQQQLDRALLMACEWLSRLMEREADSISATEDEETFKECVQLLLGKGAELDTDANKEVFDVFWPINKELVARALVPDMANEAVLGLALAATALHRRPASGEEAAGPSKRTRPSS